MYTHIFFKRIRVELGQLWNTPLTSGRFLRSRSPWITRQLGLHRETISQKKEKIMKERKKERKEGRKEGRKEERKVGRKVFSKKKKISQGSGGRCF